MISESYVFLSYSHIDRAQVSILASHLQDRAKGVFLDERVINTPALWRQFVDSHLSLSDVVLICYSRRMLERSRGWVYQEHRLITELESLKPIRVIAVCLDGSGTPPPHPFSDRTIVPWEVTDSGEQTVRKLESGLLHSEERNPYWGQKVVSAPSPRAERPSLGDRVRRLLPAWLRNRRSEKEFDIVVCDNVVLDFFGEETGTGILKTPKGATTNQLRDLLLSEYPYANLHSDEVRISRIYEHMGDLLDPKDPEATRCDQINQIVIHFGEAGYPKILEAVAERVLSALRTGASTQLGAECKVEPPLPHLIERAVADILIVKVLPLPTWDRSWADGLAADAHSRIDVTVQETLARPATRVLSVVLGASLNPTLSLGCDVRLFGCDPRAR